MQHPKSRKRPMVIGFFRVIRVIRVTCTYIRVIQVIRVIMGHWGYVLGDFLSVGAKSRKRPIYERHMSWAVQ